MAPLWTAYDILAHIYSTCINFKKYMLVLQCLSYFLNLAHFLFLFLNTSLMSKRLFFFFSIHFPCEKCTFCPNQRVEAAAWLCCRSRSDRSGSWQERTRHCRRAELPLPAGHAAALRLHGIYRLRIQAARWRSECEQSQYRCSGSSVQIETFWRSVH